MRAGPGPLLHVCAAGPPRAGGGRDLQGLMVTPSRASSDPMIRPGKVSVRSLENMALFKIVGFSFLKTGRGRGGARPYYTGRIDFFERKGEDHALLYPGPGLKEAGSGQKGVDFPRDRRARGVETFTGSRLRQPAPQVIP